MDSGIIALFQIFKMDQPQGDSTTFFKWLRQQATHSKKPINFGAARKNNNNSPENQRLKTKKT